MVEKLGLKKLNDLMTIADKIALVVVLIASLALIWLTPTIIAGTATGERDVVVNLEGEEIYRERLPDSSELQTSEFDFTIEGEQYQGVLRMKNGEVRLERLDEEISPLSIHADMGWISQSHQMIICLPIQLTVEIESTETEESPVDVRTY